ncbi:MAG: hypothetical protein M1831_003523 [Alyxoria varia]|nr:MAG: hypothetical protein M1831_003523 [Alyxoria varia]
MSLFDPAPEPKTALGRHRVLSPSAGVKVSPLCLGAMNFGTAWAEMLGPCDKNTTFEMLDFFYESGGNFIDTANNYQNEESETWIGEWMEQRGVRDEIVLATKYTTYFKKGMADAPGQASSFVGNNKKSLHVSLKQSLKKLRTDYIDVLYLHWWDFTTPVEEIMQSLNVLVQQGKILYLGISDTPAWIVSKANQYARDHGLAQFVVYQGKWNVGERDMEREIVPMCQAEGMGIAPWSALGGGKFKTKEQRESGEGRKPLGEVSQHDLHISEVLEKIAKKHNTIMTSVALAYVVHTTPDVFPIVGGRKVEHLKGNIEALKLRLDDEDMEALYKESGFDTGFPLNFLGGSNNAPATINATDVVLTNSAVRMDVAPRRQPVLPPKKA